MFIPEQARLFLYYHGDNDTTRYATSDDGVTFSYGGIALDTRRFRGADGISYARVFRHVMPSNACAYVMLFLAYEYVDGSWDSYQWHGLCCARSDDAKTWTVRTTPVIGHNDIEDRAFICSPCLFAWQERYYLVYHKDHDDPGASGDRRGEIECAEVNADLDVIGARRRFCRPQAFGADNPRVSDPCLFQDHDMLHLFVAVGRRLNQRIGLTVSPPKQG